MSTDLGVPRAGLAAAEVDREYIWTYPTALEPEAAGSFGSEPDVESWTHPLETLLYVHVPFCRADCKWCVFYRERFDAVQLERYLAALLSELEAYAAAGFFAKRTVSAIYFGGGTASLLSPIHIDAFLSRTRALLDVDPDAEVTLEGHPVTATAEYLQAARECGVNRVSFGAQSFKPETLRQLGCAHRADQVENAIALAVEAGMPKVNIDLIHRVPNQGVDDVVADLNRARELGVTGMSCYSLEARGTRYEDLGRAVDQPDDAHDQEMFYAIDEATRELGYCRIAQPDFALEGIDCKYLELIWGAPQATGFGLGPSALSPDVGGYSLLNISDLDAYCSSLEAGRLPIRAAQRVTREEAMARYFVLGFRRISVPLAPFREIFGEEPTERFREAFEELKALGLVEADDERAALTRAGLYFVDNVSKFFYTSTCTDRGVPWGLLDVDLSPEGFPPIPVSA